jgi:D-alanine transaminase
MIVYLNGRYLPKEEALVSPDDRGFLFADGVYEVVRCYNGHVFRAEDHLERLARSLRELRIYWPDLSSYPSICERLLLENELNACDATVYLHVTRGVAPRSHAFPEDPIPSTVYGFASLLETDQEKWDKGVKAILHPDLRWARCDIKSLALLPNTLATQEAKANGAEEALLVRDGAITEGSRTSFCAVFDGELFTYPDSNYILPGITRKVVLELCAELDIPVRKFPVLAGRLKEADELMILGTSTEVMPIVQVDDWKVGDGKPGPVTVKLQEAYRQLCADF